MYNIHVVHAWYILYNFRNISNMNVVKINYAIGYSNLGVQTGDDAILLEKGKSHMFI